MSDRRPKKRAASAAASGDAMATLSLYGVRLRSQHTFVNAVPRAQPAVSTEADELTFAYVEEAPLVSGWERTPHIHASQAMIDDDTSFLYVLEVGDCTVLRFSEVVDFFIWPERILCRLIDPAYDYMVELHLLGFVMAYWLELRGVLALHAAGVVVDGHAVGFLATNAGGKSSLAAGLMQSGHALLSDDILAVDQIDGTLLARPSYPQMRMWPETARRFVGTDSLARVHPNLRKRRVPVGPHGFGTFDPEARPLAVLYLPERVDGGSVAFTDLTFSETVFALERYAFLAGMLTDTGLQRRRFGALAAVATRVPVRRVRYQSGYECLHEVTGAIVDDVASEVIRAARLREG